jgi:hypothetical protein
LQTNGSKIGVSRYPFGETNSVEEKGRFLPAKGRFCDRLQGLSK